MKRHQNSPQLVEAPRNPAKKQRSPISHKSLGQKLKPSQFKLASGNHDSVQFQVLNKPQRKQGSPGLGLQYQTQKQSPVEKKAAEFHPDSKQAERKELIPSQSKKNFFTCMGSQPLKNDHKNSNNGPKQNQEKGPSFFTNQRHNERSPRVLMQEKQRQQTKGDYVVRKDISSKD